MLNVHHLGLLYYVARHGGISEAARHMPYDIQQPAVSAQILQLENHLGVTLFQRRPFALTPPGEKLCTFIKPFFDGLEAMEEALRGNAQQLRLGGSGILLRDHLPQILIGVRRKFARLKLALREGHRPQLEAYVGHGYGIGLYVSIPRYAYAPGIRVLALPGFPPVVLGAIWPGKKTPVIQAFLDEINERILAFTG